MDLSTFETRLSTLIGRPSSVRPFVCDGSPLDCDIFIVGFNPATDFSDFWKYWRSGHGFDKQRWFTAYKAHRAEEPLKAGKTYRRDVSNTRSNIEKIVSALVPHKILETNIYSTPTASAAELRLDARDSRPFEFLLESIKPRAIITHGVDAARVVREFDSTVMVESIPHLRAISQGRIEDLSVKLRAALR